MSPTAAVQQIDILRRRQQSLSVEEQSLLAAAEQRRIALTRKREQLISRRCSLLAPRPAHDPHDDAQVQAASDRLNVALRAGEEFARHTYYMPASERKPSWYEMCDRK